MLQHWFDGENSQPAHADVNQGRDQFKTAGVKQFKNNACQREYPNNTEQPPAAMFAQPDQGKRCVAAGNQNINGTVIKYF